MAAHSPQGGDCPYLGSKISLISKAKIRYEGILYTIDTENATVALSKVRSFGTEKRETERFVAPRDDVYEYIIFRGSDIEDLTVCEPPNPQAQLPADPAIVHSAMPSQAPGAPPHFQPNAQFAQQPVPVYNPYMSPTMPIQRPVMAQQTLSDAVESSQQSSVAQASSSSSTPSGGSATVSGSVNANDKSDTTGSDKVESRKGNNGIAAAKEQAYAKIESSSFHNSRQQQQKQVGNKGRMTYGMAVSSQQNQQQRTFRGGYRGGQYNSNRTSSENNDDDSNNRSMGNQQQRSNNNGANQQRRFYRNPNPVDGSPGYNPNFRGGPRGGQRGGSRRYPNRNQRDQLQFEGDFDFEESNAQFNKDDIAKELKDQLKISTGVSVTPKLSKTSSSTEKSASADGSKKEESGSGDHEKTVNSSSGASGDAGDDEDVKTPQAASEENDGESEKQQPDEEEEEEEKCFYDKSKSFFDNITCETTNPRGERMTWTEERKKNTETFGTSWNNGRGRGGYRGRNYRGRRGGGGQPGFHHHHHRGRGYMNNNFNGRGGYNNRGYFNNNYRGNNRYHDRGDYQNNNRGGYNNQQHYQHYNNHQYRRHPRREGQDNNNSTKSNYNKTSTKESNNTSSA